MKKIIISSLMLFMMMLSGCNKAPNESNNNSSSDSNSDSTPESSDTNTESSSTSESESESESTPTTSEEDNVVLNIANALKALDGKKYTFSEVRDIEDTYTYTFSYLGGSEFLIESTLKNSKNAYDYDVRFDFEWDNVKNTLINGEVTIKSGEMFRCNITCEYGNVPSITLVEYEVTDSTFSESRKKEGYVADMIVLQSEAFSKVQEFIKTVKSSYTLW